jgi:DNA polymerase-3 subunit delta'
LVSNIRCEKINKERSVDDAQEILKSLALKSYEGGYKVMIIWMADKLNTAAANKLLKLLEEPTEKRFSFLSQKTKISFKPFVSMSSTSFQWITQANIAETLVEKILIQNSLENSTSSTGNFNKALQLLQPIANLFF